MSQLSDFSRRHLLKALLGLGPIILAHPRVFLWADELSLLTNEATGPLIHAPDNPRLWPRWRKELNEWRIRTRKDLDYDGSRYREQAGTWAARSFTSCFLMLYDQTFYDHRSSHFQVETFLRQAREDFGGFDNLILWHAYPRIGADNRNQFDFYRDMPGGLVGLRDVVQRCHQLGVRAFIVYKPWDIGTRRESIEDVEALRTLVQAIGVDGVYLDTMSEAPPGLRAKLDEIGHGVIIETEGALPLQHVHDHHMSWAQYFEDRVAPGILRNKWFERRHMMHQTARWRRSRIGQLHMAWMNGSGMVVWESVFGSWVGWTKRDRSILRAMTPIQRRFSYLFTGEGWTPLVPTEHAGVYASLWEAKNVRLWSLVNRTAQSISGPLLRVHNWTAFKFFDVIAGQEVVPIVHNDWAYLQGEIGPHGIGGFVAGTAAGLGPNFQRFLANQRSLANKKIESTEFPRRPVRLRQQPTISHSEGQNHLAGMVKIPAASFTMRVQFRVRECGFYANEIDQDELYANFHKPRWIERSVTLPPYAIDTTLVTNSQYARFLLDTYYLPLHPENFLKHWLQGKPPGGTEDHPVVFVSLEDARAYANWVRKAIPTEEQWQYAAQGPEALKYPWGSSMEESLCNAGQTGTTTSVTAFPMGRSPFGCYDMCGNVWEWTESERTDGRTRFCIIRGGSFYTAEGSPWYMDGGPQPTDFAAKFLLMWPGLDRCATIGFRCVLPL